jgi:pimeloyl-ACP methyl ester carboxylesterase
MTDSLRYVAAADGTPVAYRVRGEGPPLVLANGLTTSEFFWRHVMPRWERRWRVVTWDYKGHGDSGPARDISATTPEALVDDMRRVFDDAGIERAPIVGFSMGCQIVLEACRRMPERIVAVGCLLGPAGRLFDTALPPITGRAAQVLLRSIPQLSTGVVMGGFGRIIRLPLAQRVGRLLGYIGPHAKPDDVALYMRHFARLHYPTVRAVALAAGEHDASDLLPQLHVPLLIVAGARDPFAPIKTVGEVMHRRAPSSRLVRLANGTHTSLFEHPDQIATAVEGFLDGADARASLG